MVTVDELYDNRAQVSCLVAGHKGRVIKKDDYDRSIIISYGLYNSVASVRYKGVLCKTTLINLYSSNYDA